MKRSLQNIMVTGGAGFIGTNFILDLFDNPNFKGRIINVDKLTYAGNPKNLASVEKQYGGDRYFFEIGDIADGKTMLSLFEQYHIDTVINFAAESHVDRSIFGPKAFIDSNILGTFRLLEVAKEVWQGDEQTLFHHVSTDEVYGSLGKEGYFYEDTPYDPRSPYSASKASSDHLVNAYHHTYGMNTTLSNCSNNYGPYQFPEKLLPLMINNMVEGKPLPVYGDGKNIRDWLFVRDHNTAIWLIVNKGRSGETYNIGGENEWENIQLIDELCEIVARHTSKTKDEYKKLITFVKDRPGHDRRYAINCDKIKSELGFEQSVSFKEGLDYTVQWYLSHAQWIQSVTSGEYKEWIEKNYQSRMDDR